MFLSISGNFYISPVIVLQTLYVLYKNSMSSPKLYMSKCCSFSAPRAPATVFSTSVNAFAIHWAVHTRLHVSPPCPAATQRVNPSTTFVESISYASSSVISSALLLHRSSKPPTYLLLGLLHSCYYLLWLNYFSASSFSLSYQGRNLRSMKVDTAAPPAFGRLKQRDFIDFEASLTYRVNTKLIK